MSKSTAVVAVSTRMPEAPVPSTGLAVPVPRTVRRMRLLPRSRRGGASRGWWHARGPLGSPEAHVAVGSPEPLMEEGRGEEGRSRPTHRPGEESQATHGVGPARDHDDDGDGHVAAPGRGANGEDDVGAG